MLRFLRAVQPLGIFFLLLYLAIIALHPIQHPPEVLPILNAFESLVYNDLLHLNVWNDTLHLSIVFLLIIIQAALMSIATQRAGFFHQTSLFPALVFITICFLLPNIFFHVAALLPTILFTLFLGSAVQIYKINNADAPLLNIGVLVGILSLFVPVTLLALPMIFIALFRLRTLSLREIMVVISGAFAIHFIIGSVLFFFNETDVLLNTYKAIIPGLLFTAVEMVTLKCIIIAAAYSIASIGYQVLHLGQQAIRFRRITSLWLILLLTFIAITIVDIERLVQLLPICLTLCSASIAWWWYTLKNKDIATILLISLMGLVFVFQYINFA